MTKRLSLKERLSSRSARARRVFRSRRVFRWLGGRAALTLVLGAALSVGGVADVTDRLHLAVRKDPNSVKVVAINGHRKLLTNLGRGFAANSAFTMSHALPGKYVSRQDALFTPPWLRASGPAPAPQVPHDVFHAEMARIHDTVRRDFFQNAVPFGDLIHKKALKYDVDPALVAAVVETESSFRAGAHSPVGARGLMQLMPRTGRWMGARNLDDPEQNVEAGTKYLKYLQRRFDGNLNKAIAAYNGGEGNVKRYNGVPPFRETLSYVSKVLSRYQQRHEELTAYALRQR